VLSTVSSKDHSSCAVQYTLKFVNELLVAASEKAVAIVCKPWWNGKEGRTGRVSRCRWCAATATFLLALCVQCVQGRRRGD